MIALGIALVGGLALVAPWLAAVASDRRTTPRLAAAVHLWALIAMAVLPLAMLVCLAGPGSMLRGACHGVLEHQGPLLAWTSLAAVVALLAWLAFTGSRTLRATRAADPRRFGMGQASSTAGGVPVYLLPADRPVAFAVGFWRPRVVVSRGLMDMLDGDERRAALAHEAAHVRGGHPGLLFAGRVMLQALGPFPPARRAFASLRRELEASADEQAARVVGDPEVVASAIAKVGLAAATPIAAAAPVDEADLAYRVDRLFGRYPGSKTRAAVALTLVGLLAFGVVATACGALHPGTLWMGILACSALVGWLAFRPFRPVRV